MKNPVRQKHGQEHSSARSSCDSNEHETPVELTDNANSTKGTVELTVPQRQPEEDRPEGDDDPYVPKSERRGLFPQICLVREKKEPRDYNASIKMLIVFTISFAAMVGPMGGSIFLPAITNIAADFGATKGIVNVSYGLYVLSLGIFPIWWSSISEQFGRRTVYIVSFTMYCGFLIGCARSSSMGMLMAFRILSGAGAAAVQAVGAGTISDLYINEQRGRALGYFYLGPLMGPLVGPLAGGAIVERFQWQGTQWFVMILCGAILLFILFCLPETLRVTRVPKTVIEKEFEVDAAEKQHKQRQHEPDQKAEKQQKQQQETGQKDDVECSQSEFPAVLGRRPSISSLASFVSRQNPAESDLIGDTMAPCLSHTNTNQDNSGQGTQNATSAPKRDHDRPILIEFSSLTRKEQAYLLVIKPLHSLKFLKYPPVLLSILYGSFCFFCLYMLNVSIESVYTAAPYNFGPVIIGLMFVPNSLGYVISSILAGRYSDRVVTRVRAANNGRFIAESRYAEHVFFGGLLYPLALILFGWTAYYKVFWFVPLVGTFLYGLASMIIFGTTMTYLVDALPGRGSSGVAVNNLVRMVLAAVSTFIAQPLQSAMGVGWLFTMLGLVGLVLLSLIMLVKVKGKKWRESVDLDDLYS